MIRNLIREELGILPILSRFRMENILFHNLSDKLIDNKQTIHQLINKSLFVLTLAKRKSYKLARTKKRQEKKAQYHIDSKQFNYFISCFLVNYTDYAAIYKN